MAQGREYGRRQNISTADIETANIFELILYALANGTGDQSLGIDENGKAKTVAGGAAAWGGITGTLTDQAEIDTDVALAADSDLKLATQKAVKAYADALVAGLLDYRGTYNASVNTFPAAGGSGAGGAVKKADTWYVSVAGTLGGTAVIAGDAIIAKIDTPGQTAGNWNILNVGLGFVPENVANKSTDVNLGASDTLYPSQKAVKDYVDAHAGAGGLGYALNVQGTLPGTLSDGATYYAGNALMTGVYDMANKNRIYIRKAGTIKIADILLYSGSVVGTNEEISVYIRLNDTADTLISALSVADAIRDFNNSALSVAVVAGDYITIKMVCPTWATNPQGAYISGHVYIE